MKVLMILLTVICTPLHAEQAGSVKLPSITSIWSVDKQDNLAPITIEEISQCMGKESGLSKEYAAFNETMRLFNAESTQLEALSKKIAAERLRLDEQFKNINEKIAQLSDNAKSLDAMKVALTVLGKQKLDAKQAKEANLKVANYNQMVNVQNEHAKKVNVDSDNLSQAQQLFNTQLEQARQNFDQFNQKAESFEAQRLEMNKKITQVTEQCSGEKRLVK